jgi:hypothetical protein
VSSDSESQADRSGRLARRYREDADNFARLGNATAAKASRDRADRTDARQAERSGKGK